MNFFPVFHCKIVGLQRNLGCQNVMGEVNSDLPDTPVPSVSTVQ